jgi:two-component system chemotaxis response regulator CheB
MIRVLIVDDSAFMRKALTKLIEEDPGLSVAGTARDGIEAIEQVRTLKPDVVTMDVQMPRMDGISAVKKIMAENPVPILMVSSLTREGAETTIEALQAGAIDFIAKESSYVTLNLSDVRDELAAKIRNVARSRLSLFQRPRTVAPASPSPRPATGFKYQSARLIAIGISTGGPLMLQKVIPALPGNLRVPVVIVQHMPPHFTKSLAERLNAKSALEVVEAEEGMKVLPGHVYIAPGGKHLTFRNFRQEITLETPAEPASSLHKPCVDVMLKSAVDVYSGRVLALIMTGMGNDGLEGCRLVKQRGGKVLSQDEGSCVVYGMPKAVFDAGVSDAVVSLERIAGTLEQAVSTSTRPQVV